MVLPLRVAKALAAGINPEQPFATPLRPAAAACAGALSTIDNLVIDAARNGVSGSKLWRWLQAARQVFASFYTDDFIAWIPLPPLPHLVSRSDWLVPVKVLVFRAMSVGTPR